MSEKEHDFRSLVCIYAQLLPMIRKLGKELGYAIAIHGSMDRDLDLLAVPWVDDAWPAQTLVEVIARAASATNRRRSLTGDFRGASAGADVRLLI